MKRIYLLLIGIILVGSVSATSYYIISNYMHKEATLHRIQAIGISYVNLPTDVDMGKETSFLIRIVNNLDQPLHGLNTYIRVWFEKDNATVAINQSWITFKYYDGGESPQPTDPLLGYLNFTMQANNTLLCNDFKNWTAPAHYDSGIDTIRFLVDTQSTIPDGAKLCIDVWVTGPDE